ncbi:MAG: lysozyme [Podoviridae sp. ctpVR23]|nr:MAG: lysozyme [Podoviridae sp. ctpVR23]
MDNLIKVAKDRAVAEIKVEEGYRLKPYYCSNRFPTIGYGTKIGPKDAPLDMYQFSMPEPAAHVMVVATVDSLCDELMAKLPWFKTAPNALQMVLICMAYQLGIAGVLGFRKALEHMEAKLYREAAKEMLDSKWFRVDSPARAKRMSQIVANL